MSSITTPELALINATWLTLIEPEFQCRQIEEGYKKRKDAKVVTNYRRIEKGCGKISKTPRVEIDGIEYYSCLCHENFQDTSIHDLIWLHSQYNKGHLAYIGGLLDQPSKYIGAMRLLDRLQDEYDIKMRENNGK